MPIVKSLFKTVSNQFKHQHNETILSIQYWKFCRLSEDMAENGWTDQESKQLSAGAKKLIGA